MVVDDVVGEIVAACESMAGLPYDGEPVDQLEHALQAAALARAEDADDELLAAALLHDIARAPAVAGITRDAADHHHGELGSAWLTPRVGETVAWLAEQHVAAKRYLVAVDPAYRAALSPTSIETLEDQGGAMDAAEVAAAEAAPDWARAVRLRRWDDAAKVPGERVPGLDAYRDVLRGLVVRSAAAGLADRDAGAAGPGASDDVGGSATTRAMVFDGPGRPLRAVDVPVPAPGAGEVAVRITATTLCGSDLSSFAGHRAVATPTVLGHESVGVVEATGDGAHDLDGAPLTPGTRVTWSITASCVDCAACRSGIPQKCERLVKYGHERLGDAAGPAGGLAGRVVLPRGTAIVAVPDGVPDRVACPASCATATVAGAIRVAGVGPEDVVVVTGLGMLGLTACAMASAAGATVVGVDVDERRVALAQRFGVHRALLLDEALRDGVPGASVLLELSGAPDTTAAAIGWLGLAGRAVLVGAVHPGPPVPLDAELVVRRLLRIEGLHNYVPDDLRRAVAFLGEHGARFPFADLVPHEHPLADADAAFAAAKGGAPRVLVRP